MTPQVQIKADDHDITDAIIDRLLDLSVQDNAGLNNDKVSIQIDDRKIGDQWIALPPIGTRLDISMGYLDADNQDVPAPLTFIGQFTLDEVEIEFSGKGRTFTIHGHATAMDGPFKEVRSRSYHETTLGDIVEKCAKRCKMEAVIEPGFESIYVQHLDQSEESDMAFLTRLYDLYGTIAKPSNGKLLFGSPEGLQIMQGKLDKVFIEEDEVLAYRYLLQTRGKFNKVKVNYYDTDEGTVKTAESGGPGTYAVWDDKTKSYKFMKGDSPLGKIPESPFPTSGEAAATATTAPVNYTSGTTASNQLDAEAEANAKKNALDKSKASLHVEMIGDPEIESGGVVHLSKFRPEIPLKWHVTKVTHNYSDKGYITTFEADSGAEKKDASDVNDGGQEPARPNPLSNLKEYPFPTSWEAKQSIISAPPQYNGEATSLTNPVPITLPPPK